MDLYICVSMEVCIYVYVSHVHILGLHWILLYKIHV